MPVDTFASALADWASKEAGVTLDDSFKQSASDYITSLKSGVPDRLEQRKMAAILVAYATAKVRKLGRTVATDKDFETALNDVQPLWMSTEFERHKDVVTSPFPSVPLPLTPVPRPEKVGALAEKLPKSLQLLFLRP